MSEALIPLPPALTRALFRVYSGLALAGRDMDLVTPEDAAAVEAACAAAPDEAFLGDLDAAMLAAEVGEGIRASSGVALTLPIDAEGLVSTAVHLAAVVAIRKQLLPALYRIETTLQPRVHESAQTAEAITLIERARRRVAASGEALREVALAGPQTDPRFPGEEQSLAARALGFVNQAERVQLKLAPGNLRPGGTWDAALEALMQLDLLEAVLAHVAGRDAAPHPVRAVQPWPAMGTLLMSRIEECVAAAAQAAPLPLTPPAVP